MALAPHQIVPDLNAAVPPPAPSPSIREVALRGAMEIYADLLLPRIVDYVKKFQTLNPQILKGFEGEGRVIDIFAWNTVSFTQSLSDYKAALARMSPEERQAEFVSRGRIDKMIYQRDWQHAVCVMKNDPAWEMPYPILSMQSLDRIFRYSTLAERIALALGPQFVPVINTKIVRGPAPGSNGFWVKEKTLSLCYYPNALPADAQRRLKHVAEMQESRMRNGKIRVLDKNESLTGYGFWR